MLNNILTEMFVLSTFTFALIFGAYDKRENFNNQKVRELIGYLILFSIAWYFSFHYIKKDH